MRDGMRHYINPDELDVLRRFVDSWEDLSNGDHKVLELLVRRLDADVAEQSSEAMREVRSRVQHAFDDSDDTHVDDDAEIMKVEAGYWVQAWLWFP